MVCWQSNSKGLVFSLTESLLWLSANISIELHPNKVLLEWSVYFIFLSWQSVTELKLLTLSTFLQLKIMFWSYCGSFPVKQPTTFPLVGISGTVKTGWVVLNISTRGSDCLLSCIKADRQAVCIHWQLSLLPCTHSWEDPIIYFSKKHCFSNVFMRKLVLKALNWL